MKGFSLGLVCGGIIVRNLGYGGITVRNLSTRYTLAYKINSKNLPRL